MANVFSFGLNEYERAYTGAFGVTILSTASASGSTASQYAMVRNVSTVTVTLTTASAVQGTAISKAIKLPVNAPEIRLPFSAVTISGAGGVAIAYKAPGG